MIILSQKFLPIQTVKIVFLLSFCVFNEFSDRINDLITISFITGAADNIATICD